MQAPPNMGQQQQQHVNLMPSYQFQHFVGAPGAADISAHMPDKMEVWDHHDKHVSVSALLLSTVVGNTLSSLSVP